MNVVGVLSWYDESPSWLATACAGYSRVCDHIVAVDGAYQLYPGGTARSRPDQAEAIMQTCEAAGTGCTIVRPSHVWALNELGKRNHCLRVASTLDPDWLVCFDADYHVTHCDPDIVRWELEHTEANVATYALIDGLDVMAGPLADRASTVDVPTDWKVTIADIFRWTPDLAYVGAHYIVGGTYDGKWQWVKGADIPADAANLTESLVAHHRMQHRPMGRNQAREGYYQARDTLRIEPGVAETAWL